MYKRDHHQRVQIALEALDGRWMRECGMVFGGGTSSVLQLGEYRESVDIDILCSSPEGYRALRNTVTSAALGRLAAKPLRLARDIRMDAYAVRALLDIDGTAIKLELIREARFDLQPSEADLHGVPLMTRHDAFVEKILANADRGRDGSTFRRDMVDLLFMRQAWGDIPEAAWNTASAAYGAVARREYDHVLSALCVNPSELSRAASALGFDEAMLSALCESAQTKGPGL